MRKPTPSHVLVLVRGHPGSGKTTYAKALQARIPGMQHIENDDLFTSGNGVYAFDLARHQEAKDSCLERTRAALEQGRSVVVSNTFTTLAELAPYQSLAQSVGCACRVVEAYGVFPNVHAVPDAVVAAKRAAFEPWPGAVRLSFDPAQPASRRPRHL